MNITNSDVDTKYIYSLFWAVQTITTVGYGDLTPYTDKERIIAILLMFFGTGFYSIFIGKFKIP